MQLIVYHAEVNLMNLEERDKAGPLRKALGRGGPESELSCTEEILIRVNEKLQLPKWSLGYGNWVFSKTFLKIASGFGGGVGGRGSVCGALSGGVMALGIAYGTDGTENYETFEKKRRNLKEKAKKLIKAFEGEFGSVNCSELLGCYAFWTENGRKQYDELKSTNKLKCSDYIRFSAQFVSKVIKSS